MQQGYELGILAMCAHCTAGLLAEPRRVMADPVLASALEPASLRSAPCMSSPSSPCVATTADMSWYTLCRCPCYRYRCSVTPAGGMQIPKR